MAHLPAYVPQIFSSTTSMDEAEKYIDYYTKNSPLMSRIAVWKDIFTYSQTLGKQQNTAPQIRGRAGEKITQLVCEVIATDVIPNKNLKGFHSLHVGTTEIDYLFLTPWVIFPIEIKSQKANNNRKIRDTLGGAAQQNAMHMRQLETFLKEQAKLIANQPIKTAPLLVWAAPGNPDSMPEILGDHLVAHVTKVYDTILKRIVYGKQQNHSIPNYDYLVQRITEYYKSPSHTLALTRKKKRGGYV